MPDPEIRAEVHSDDLVFEVDFDAEPWFVQASDDDILDLVDCEWGGNYPADGVAHFFEDSIHDIGDMMGYCQRKDGIGFECHINEEDALKWLAASRPQLFDRVKAIGA